MEGFTFCVMPGLVMLSSLKSGTKTTSLDKMGPTLSSQTSIWINLIDYKKNIKRIYIFTIFTEITY